MVREALLFIPLRIEPELLQVELFILEIDVAALGQVDAQAADHPRCHGGAAPGHTRMIVVEVSVGRKQAGLSSTCFENC